MRFSIITPSLNRCEMLRGAMASVRDQGISDLEHIVVDGGSDDGTLGMLSGAPASVIVVQDRRRGLYDAINMGIELATGDVIGVLNSDDLYAPGALVRVRREFERQSTINAVCGAAEEFDEFGRLALYDDPRDLRLDAHAALVGASITNARFFRRAVFERVGLFPTEYDYVADRAFLVALLISGVETAYIKELTYRYRVHRGSLTLARGARNRPQIRRELVTLAKNVWSLPNAPETLRVKARALFGRCCFKLAADRIAALDVIGAAGILLEDCRPIARRSVAAIAFGAIDRILSGDRR